MYKLFDYIKTPEGFLPLISIIVAIYFGVKSIKKSIQESRGGRGGNATASGINSRAIGGKGGGSGPYGTGGAGGDAETKGENSFSMGGEGGEAGQVDRGGKGGRGPMEVLGIPNRQLPDGTWLWDIGKGGDGTGPTINNK